MNFLNPKIHPLLLLLIFVLLFYSDGGMRSLPLWCSLCMGFMLWLPVVVGEKWHPRLDDWLCRWLDDRRAKLKK